MMKSFALTALLLTLLTQNAFAAKGLGNFQQEFAAVCAAQMQQQAGGSGLQIPGSTIQAYCNCTSAHVVQQANGNPVLMKMLSDPSTPNAALEGYFRTAAGYCTQKHIK